MQMVFWISGAVLFSAANLAMAADSLKSLTIEADPIAPTSAIYEDETSNVATSKWGASADFNVGSFVSTGPEFWIGTFAVKGPEDPTERVRREDFLFGESHKLDATRLRWNMTRWEKPTSMRGWFVKMGYSYTRINSRASRTIESNGSGEGDVVLPNVFVAADNDGRDLVSDVRHGVVFGFGQRWMWFDNRLSFTTGASFTMNLKREVTVDGTDPDTLSDYENLIEELPNTRMSVRPFPEVNIALGWST